MNACSRLEGGPVLGILLTEDWTARFTGLDDVQLRQPSRILSASLLCRDWRSLSAPGRRAAAEERIQPSGFVS
jgi:hypothetical protein